MTQTAAQVTPWVPPDTFGTRILRARKYLKLSGPKAAKKCGVPSSTWANWEAGARPADLVGAATAVSGGLGADRDWLLFGGSEVISRYLTWDDGQLTFPVADSGIDGREVQGDAWKTPDYSTSTRATSAPEDSPKTPSAATTSSTGRSPATSPIAA